jgi:hypothetical protein
LIKDRTIINAGTTAIVMELEHAANTAGVKEPLDDFYKNQNLSSLTLNISILKTFNLYLNVIFINKIILKRNFNHDWTPKY